ncbi:MAG: hypothetical protein V4487_00395 [Chlamydiota bacterium]
MNSLYPIWRKEALREEDGIVVGSDQTQEWLLPWWWDNYLRYNAFPVTFVNFGLSLEMKKWCQERGELIRLPIFDLEVKEKGEIETSIATEWELKFGKTLWQSRGAWFKKPLACLQSPYRRSLWIDLDCEIRGSLKEIFHHADHFSGIGLVKELENEGVSYPIYNSGVIAFRRNLPLIQEWSAQTFTRNQLFRGDQELLSQIIYEKSIPVSEMDPRYNWSWYHKNHPNVVIYHWHEDCGRRAIRHRIQCRELDLLLEIKNPI